MRTITPRTLKMLQVRTSRMCTRISFSFRKRSGKSKLFFFLSMTKIQLKRVKHKLSRWTIYAPSTGRFREASSGPDKVWFSTALSKKRQTSWIVDSFCEEATNLKKPNTTDLERDLQRPRLRRPKIDGGVNTLGRSIKLLFSLFFNDRLTTK